MKCPAFYLKTERGVLGPLAAEKIVEMLASRIITAQTPVSQDGLHWQKAESFNPAPTPENNPDSAPEKALPVQPARPELRGIVSLLERSLRSLHLVFPLCSLAGGLAATIATFALADGLNQLLGLELPAWLALGIICPPLLLAALGGGHLTGNLVLRLWTRLGPAERVCLALHLPWNRVPAHWPQYLVNWLYTGDWLKRQERDEMLPYMRAFVTGGAPATIEEELRIWSELTRRGSFRGEFEIGQSVRELACMDRLPGWTREIENGADLPTLTGRLGPVANEWSASLLRRAAQRLPNLFAGDAETALNLVDFEFQYCRLPENRECMLVIIRPRDTETPVAPTASAAA